MLTTNDSWCTNLDVCGLFDARATAADNAPHLRLQQVPREADSPVAPCGAGLPIQLWP